MSSCPCTADLFHENYAWYLVNFAVCCTASEISENVYGVRIVIASVERPERHSILIDYARSQVLDHNHDLEGRRPERQDSEGE